MAKGKNILYQCGHCERITKMELIGAVENQPEKSWYRCTRCRHATLINVETLKQSLQDAKKKLDRSNAVEYNPINTYKVGEAIFHSEWDDIGKIISKERTSDGTRAIVVSFEKLGERRLLESVTHEPENGQQESSV
jgi:DNA-directed RNA polymerase subunit RPC12/RpoP